MKKRVTLKNVNAYIQTKYPVIQLIKGNGYFWVYSEDDNIGLQLAGLYTTSIDIPRITMLTEDEWLDKVEWIMTDPMRYLGDRTPVKF